MEPWRDELCHFGVKGMKWGVRHDRKRQPGYRMNKKEEIKNNPYMEKAKKQAKSAIGLATGAIGGKATIFALNASGHKDVANALGSSYNLIGKAMSAGAVIQASRAGFNYMKSRGYVE